MAVLLWAWFHGNKYGLTGCADRSSVTWTLVTDVRIGTVQLRERLMDEFRRFLFWCVLVLTRFPIGTVSTPPSTQGRLERLYREAPWTARIST